MDFVLCAPNYVSLGKSETSWREGSIWKKFVIGTNQWLGKLHFKNQRVCIKTGVVLITEFSIQFISSKTKRMICLVCTNYRSPWTERLHLIRTNSGCQLDELLQPFHYFAPYSEYPAEPQLNKATEKIAEGTLFASELAGRSVIDIS